MINKKILVLEDERALKIAINHSLIKSGFDIVEASKVDEALKLLEENGSVDAVWLDHYLLGGDNGIDFLGKLKENDQWKNIPVFVVTNLVSDDKITTYEVLGIESYFVKSDNSLTDIIASIKNKIL
ncbi:MAG: response regulator [Candidatus Saccharibacteria bacterium]